MGYKFSLVLNREVDDQETAQLRDSLVGTTTFVGDQLPTNADVSVTRIEIDDEKSPTLAEAIQSAFDVVHAAEGLSIPGLSVPAQPAGPVDGAKIDQAKADDAKVDAATDDGVELDQDERVESVA